MSSKAIYEGDGKRLLKLHLKDDSFKSPSFINISEHDNLDEISVDWPKEEVRSCIVVNILHSSRLMLLVFLL